MTERSPDRKAQIIAPDAYPQMLSRPNAQRALKTLQSPQTHARAQVAINSCAPMLQDAIRDYVEAMEAADADAAAVFAIMHEVRGFAGNAGMVATGRIADSLCRYIDEMDRVKKAMDPAIMTLHLRAIGQVSRTEHDDPDMTDAVAAELNALVMRRLAEAGVGSGR